METNYWQTFSDSLLGKVLNLRNDCIRAKEISYFIPLRGVCLMADMWFTFTQTFNCIFLNVKASSKEDLQKSSKNRGSFPFLSLSLPLSLSLSAFLPSPPLPSLPLPSLPSSSLLFLFLFFSFHCCFTSLQWAKSLGCAKA